MRLSALLLLAPFGLAACAPVPVRPGSNVTVNGNVINRTGVNPDTPPSAPPAPVRDNPVNTDPAAPRTTGPGQNQRVQPPVLTE